MVGDDTLVVHFVENLSILVSIKVPCWNDAVSVLGVDPSGSRVHSTLHSGRVLRHHGRGLHLSAGAAPHQRARRGIRSLSHHQHCKNEWTVRY